MKLVPWRRAEPAVEGERDLSFALPFQDWIDQFTYNGNVYPLPIQQTLIGRNEEIGGDYSGLVQGAYRANGVVFACMAARMLHFAQARFQFQQMRNGKPGDLFGTPDLGILETPWPNGTTADLLARMIQDADLAGNSYIVRQGNRLARLRPDWTNILLVSSTNRENWVPGDPDTEVAGYVYKPGGLRSSVPAMRFLPEQVAHFAPYPDPQAIYRGMSWLTPLIREIQADQAMTAHRLKFMENGATVNMVVKLPADTLDKFNAWVSRLEEGHKGLANAYRTMYLGQGADATAVGANMEQIDFKAVQGAGEVRIATAARVPPTLLGISEGLQGSTLNAGNYQIVIRRFTDEVLRYLWMQAAGALATLLPAQGGARLWYDDCDIAFLKEDVKDAAEIASTEAQTIHTLISAGFEPDSVVAAISSGDWSLLAHSGLYSVQLQPAAAISEGKGAVVQGVPVQANGNGSKPAVPA